MEKIGKMALFCADMARLGKYRMRGYCPIGIYRVKNYTFSNLRTTMMPIKMVIIT